MANPTRNRTSVQSVNVSGFNFAPNTGNTIACWSGWIAGLLKKHGPHSRIILRAESTGVFAVIETDVVVREEYVPVRPKVVNPALERFKDMAWEKLTSSMQISLKSGTNWKVRLAAWEQSVVHQFYALQNPGARPPSVLPAKVKRVRARMRAD